MPAPLNPPAISPGVSKSSHPVAVEFTERLTGSMAPAGDEGTRSRYEVELNDLLVRVALNRRTPQGGLSGLIAGGSIAIPGLHFAPLPVHAGIVELLARAPTGEGRMRYRLEFGDPGDSGPSYVLRGVKHLAARRMFSPRTIWRDTTTMFSGIYQMPAERLVLVGPLVLNARDFVRQLRSMRADQAADPDDDAAAVPHFLATFVAKTTRIYLGRALRPPGPKAPTPLNEIR